MKKALTAALSVSAIVLSGCATAPGSCDATNTDVSLIAKMNCDHSGGYSEQVRQNEQELMNAREENAAFHQVYQDIQKQQSETRANLEQERAQDAALDKSLKNLVGQLKKRRSLSAQEQQKIGALESEIANIQARPASNNPGEKEAKRAELAALRKKVSQLQMSLEYE